MAYALRKRARISYAPAEEDDENLDEPELPIVISNDFIDDDGEEDDFYDGLGRKRQKKVKKSQRAVKVSKTLLKSQPFPFLRLPAEIRNTIYELCLPTKDKQIELYLGRRQSNPCAVRVPIYTNGRYDRAHMQILRLNKQIHSEAASLLYSRELVFPRPNVLQAFMGQIGPRHREMLRDMDVRIDRRQNRLQAVFVFDVLALATNITRLHLHSSWNRQIWRHTFYSGAHDESANTVGEGTELAKQIHGLAIHWFDSMARCHGRADAGMSILSADIGLFKATGRVLDVQSPVTSDPSNPWVTTGVYHNQVRSDEIHKEKADARKGAFDNELRRLLNRSQAAPRR